MGTTPWLLIAILIILIGFVFVAIYMKRKTKTPTDYYTLFVIGIIWLAAGIPIKNYALSAMGAAFMITGLVNKSKWKENHRSWKDLKPEEKKFKTIIIVVLGVLVLLGIVAYFITEKGRI